MKKWLGRIMVAAPFMAILVGMGLDVGWWFPLAFVGAVCGLFVWWSIADKLMDS